nr:reverse transcriptase domain-containing protein [Tanacetum cinerariifolium]
MWRNQSSRLEILIRLTVKKGIRNEDKTPQKGPTQNWLMTLAASTSTVTQVSVIRKHAYGYLEEIVNQFINLSGDNVADFAIALRMFIGSLVIQKRIEDLQLEVESYQKQINVTKPNTTRPDLRKRYPYTPYKNPQGFIYVDGYQRNRLMRSNELYKFSDGTLTRLLSSLEDITKNLDMEFPDGGSSSQGQAKANAICSYSTDNYKDIMKAQSFMAEPLSPNHVFDFMEDDATLNEEEFEEYPEEAQEMDVDVEVGLDDEMNELELILPYEGVPFTGSRFLGIYAQGGSLSNAPVVYHPEDLVPNTEFLTLKRIKERRQRINAFNFDLGVEEQHDSRVEHMMTTLEDHVPKLEKDRVRILIELHNYAVDRTMLPKRLKKRDVDRLVKNQVAEAITEYKRKKTDLEIAGGSSGAGNTGGVKAPKILGCSYKTFLNRKPHSFNGAEGVVGLSPWFEKIESVFEISKYGEEDKVKFAACTLEGRALTWWNGNVHTLGLTSAPRGTYKNARRRAYVMRTEYPQQNPNIVTGTFLINDHCASILFDSGVEKSFVSTTFTPFIDIAPATLDTRYDVELAYGKVVGTNIVLRGFTLALFNHVFKIDLLLTRLGSFDVIVRMDWLSNHRVEIVCFEKIVQISLPNGETLEVLEFRIDLIPRALPVVRSSYRLAPSEMLELSNQLKEIQDKGFGNEYHKKDKIQAKPSTKQKACKSQKSTKVNKKSTPIKSKLPSQSSQKK